MKKWEQFVNAAEVRKTLAILKAGGVPYEIRILTGDKKGTISGYFDDADTLLNSFDTVDLRNANVYITLNDLKPGADQRIQRDHFLKTSLTTSDNDIAGYRWLFIDLDPKRLSGISSSKEELDAAIEVAGKVYEHLKGLGFEDPVKALSGNGCHLLYRISLANNEDNRALVQNCLKVLASLFNNDAVSVDTTNYNPSRICKLHGTLAQKGSNSSERPHRFSRIFTNVVDVKVTQKMFLEKLASEIPDDPPPEEPQRTYQPDGFDLVKFMADNGITYKEDSNDRAKIYKLDYCPFDSTHTNGDAKIFQYTNGAIAFKCHHNSCNRYKWQDVRLKFEPTAYDEPEIDKRIDEGYKEHNRLKSKAEVPYTELVDKGEMFRNAVMIEADVEPEHEFIKSGVTVIDQRMMGFEKACVSVISGLRGCGKSTLIGQIILNAVQERHTVVCYSGELNNKKYLSWLMRQAAGKTNIEVSTKYQGGYGVSAQNRAKIAAWMGDCFWLYNNKYGNRFDAIAQHLRVILKEKKADLCIIDNMMALDLTAYNSNDKYEAQTNFVWELKNLADLTNTHIIFVAHPRKANGFLRLVDIAGSGNIGNIVDNAFIIHRWNHDFEKGYEDEFKHAPGNDIPECSNVIEITKEREGGMQDVFIPLYYEESTKRMRNDPDEYVCYGWDDNRGCVQVDEKIPF